MLNARHRLCKYVFKTNIIYKMTNITKKGSTILLNSEQQNQQQQQQQQRSIVALKFYLHTRLDVKLRHM